jgi:hypothetical protein
MTFLDIQKAVILARWSPDMLPTIKRWINQRYAWLWSQQEWPFKKNALANLTVTAGDSTPTMPTGVTVVNRIYNQSGTEVFYLTPDQFDDLYTNQPNTGVPANWTMINSQVYLGPTPDGAYTFKIAYESRMTPLVANTDTPLIPSEYHNILITGALSAGMREEGDLKWMQVESEFQMLYDAMVQEFLPPDRGSPRQYGRDDL